MRAPHRGLVLLCIEVTCHRTRSSLVLIKKLSAPPSRWQGERSYVACTGRHHDEDVSKPPARPAVSSQPRAHRAHMGEGAALAAVVLGAAEPSPTPGHFANDCEATWELLHLFCVLLKFSQYLYLWVRFWFVTQFPFFWIFFPSSYRTQTLPYQPKKSHKATTDPFLYTPSNFI